MATKEVVTVIEVLSPANKHREKDVKCMKKSGIRYSEVALILWRLICCGVGNLCRFLIMILQRSYRILVSRGNQRPLADLYLFNLPDVIPGFSLPLRAGDVEPIVDLQALLNTVYDRAAYDITLNYMAELVPALSESDAVWADALLSETSLRQSET